MDENLPVTTVTTEAMCCAALDAALRFADLDPDNCDATKEDITAAADFFLAWLTRPVVQ